jgi:hypothetical protein
MNAGASASHVRPWLAATLSAALTAAQSPVLAQPSPPLAPTRQSDEERATARAAATEGVQLLEQGRYAEALDRLRRAEALVHAPTHLLYIARTEAKLGLLVEASETYVRIVREALPSDAPKAFVDAQATAAQEGKELDGRIPTLLIRLDGPEAGDATVTMDGTPLPPPMIGLAFPVNPGAHVLRAVAKSGASAEAHIKLVPGAHETAQLPLRARVAASAISLHASATDPTPAVEGPPPTPEAVESRGPMRGSELGRALGFAAVGLGGAGLAVGTVFVVINRSKRTDANDLCPGNVCPVASKAQIQSLDQQADNAGAAAWLGYGIGGAALATGFVLLIASGGDKNKGTSSRLYPWIGTGSGGVAGEF